MEVKLISFLFYGIKLLDIAEAFANVSIARGKPTMQSVDYSTFTSNLAVDGGYSSNFDDSSCSHAWDRPESWWTVDLLGVFTIDRVVIYNRNIAQEKMDNLYVEVFVMEDPYLCSGQASLCGFNPGPSGDVVTVECPNNTIARYIRLRGHHGLNFCEVDVFGQAISWCEKWGFTKETGKKLVEFFHYAGTAPTRTDCIFLCQRFNTFCNVFNYNEVNGTCLVPTRPVRESSLVADDSWDLYYSC